MSELTNLVAKQNEESYQLGKKHGAIEELKKIKEEIKQSQNLYYYNSKTDIYEAMFKTDTILKVIDNHIKELKGE